MPLWSGRFGRVTRDFALSIALWVPLSMLVGWQTYFVEKKDHLPVILSTVLLVYAVRYLTVALLTPPIFYIVTRWPVSSAVLPRTAGYVLGYLPFALAFTTIRWFVLPPWSENTATWEPRTMANFLDLFYDTFADALLLYLVVVVSAHAYAYFVRGQRQEIERLELRQSLAQSELQALRAQLHPHFLFNILQGVSTLIDTDRPTAQNMLRALAGLLRTVLGHGSSDVITFREELAIVHSYLDLENMRLGKRLEVRWHLETDVFSVLIPQLLLLTLIENAIVHGIANSREGGWIEVSAGFVEGRLRVVIRNTVTSPSPPGFGVGIKNTRARLMYLYSDDATFEFHAGNAAGIAEAILSLPALAANGLTEE
jgi:hypothetical protein